MSPTIDFRVFADAILYADLDGVLTAVETGPEGPLVTVLATAVGRHYRDVLPADGARALDSCFAALAGQSHIAHARFDIGTELGARRFEARVVRHEGAAGDVTIALRDITGLEASATGRARDADAVYRSIFDGAGTGISVVMRGGTIVETNQAFQDMLGYTADEIRGRHYLDFCHPDDIELDATHRQRINAGDHDAFKVTKRYLAKDGRTIWADLTVSVLRDAEGAVALGIGMIEDQTQRTHAEEALRASEERFRIALQRE